MSAWLQAFFGGLGVLIVTFLVWNVKTLPQVQDVLFGPDGQNGLRSRVKATEDALDGHDVTLARHDERISHLERGEAA